MARHATLIRFDGSMFKDKRTHRVGVALGADGELACCRADLVADLGPVWIMAITALHQSYIDAVTIGTCKLGFLVGMASKAQLRLRLHKHEIHIGGFVRTVA